MRIAILGAGAWGSGMAAAFGRDHEIALWSRDPARLDEIERTRESAYLPGIALPAAVRVERDAERAASASELVVVATSTAGMHPALMRIRAVRAPSVIWACKGFDAGSGRLPHEIVEEVLPGANRVGALSGPSFALEVARGLPAALTVASRDGAFGSEAPAPLTKPPITINSSIH